MATPAPHPPSSRTGASRAVKGRVVRPCHAFAVSPLERHRLACRGHAMPCRIFLCFTSPFSRSPHRTSPCPPGFSPVRADPNMERATIDSLFTTPTGNDTFFFPSTCLDISRVSAKRLLRLFQRHTSFHKHARKVKNRCSCLVKTRERLHLQVPCQ